MVRRHVSEIGRAVLDCVTVRRCVACGELGMELCAPCARLLDERRAPWCDRCGAPLAPGARCTANHRWMRNITIARAPFRYAGTAGALVRRLKFESDRGAGTMLAAKMAAAMRVWAHRDGRRAVVVAVPLHARKRRGRPIDQAAFLAREVAGRLGLTFADHALRRVRATLPQGDPRVTSRDRNVEGAFRVRRPERLRGRVVLLVDDVTTSGATARECARTILRGPGGARSVALVTACVARG